MMATQKRAKHNSSGRPAIRTNAEQNAAPSAPAVGPTISVTASPPRDPAASTRSPASPAAERAAMVRRRKIIAAGVSLLALLIAFLAYRALTSETPSVATPVVAPTAALRQPAVVATAAPIAAPVAPVAAPAVLPTAAAVAAPVAPIAPTVAAAAAPVAAPATLPTAAVPAVGVQCATIAGLPLFDGATCTEQKSDQDDGVTKLKNTYIVGATADEIRRFYESAFASNGWTLGSFKYDISQGQRRAKIDVGTDQGPSGILTEIQLTEYVTIAPSSTSCAPIAGLPAYPNAACTKFKSDHADDGTFKVEHTFSTSASPEEVRQFYATALAQNGWTGPDFQYDLQQGLRRMQVDVETKQGAQGSFTELRIAEK
jgi:hypothetical protein